MEKPLKTSALAEVNGISQPSPVSEDAAKKLVSRRKKDISAQDLIDGIFSKDMSSLSRAITLVESTNPDHRQKASEIIAACLPKANNSIRIGITGVPGVGKSTFIEAFGKYLTGIGKKVAVLAVDPSSSLSHGSILGDKTRMEELVKDENAYIRPSASGETLGGVARKTRETITLCEAFGFDIIIIETVGVGQSETAVHGMTDFFLLLQIAGAGDELQGIKRGIMEMADAIVINKADGDNLRKAKMAKAEFGRALHFFPEKPSGWMPKAVTCSAIQKEGIAEIWSLVSDYVALTKENGFFDNRRSEQNLEWMKEAIDEQLRLRFYSDKEISAQMEKLRAEVLGNRISSFAAANELLGKYFGK